MSPLCLRADGEIFKEDSASPCPGRCPESNETLSNYSCVESVGLWGLERGGGKGQLGKVYFI